MNLTKTMLVALLLFLISGCSETEPGFDEFPEFEQFKDSAISGDNVNCDLIASTKITKTMGRFMGRARYNHDVLDFIADDGYEFEMCPNIQKMISTYCAERLKSAVNYYLGDNKEYMPREKFLKLCQKPLLAEIKSVNYEYVLPHADNKFLELKTEGVLLDPRAIIQIEYGKPQPALFALYLVTEKGRHSLYFGSQELRDKAKIEIVALVSKI